MLGQSLLIIFAFSLVFLGSVGIVLPLLPSVPIAWLGMVAFGIATNFTAITVKIIIIFLALTFMTLVLDIAAPLLGARIFHASRYGVVGSSLGLIFGFLFFGPFGIILGPFIGALFGEILRGRDPKRALQSASGVVLGFLAGSAIKLAIILAMLGFMVSALFSL